MKKTRKKVRIAGVIFLLLLIYLFFMAGYYFLSMPIKSVVVLNNNLVSENEIISMLNIKEDTPIFKINSINLKKKLKKNDLIKEAKINKELSGQITIKIVENEVLFYNDLEKKYVLSSGKSIEGNFLGKPVLISSVPSEVYDEFIKRFVLIDKNVSAMISEIEYKPDTYNDTIIDDERFLLRMNDGNMVYINNANIEKLNKYQSIYTKVGSGGILYLDSSSKNYVFALGQEEAVESSEKVSEE